MTGLRWSRRTTATIAEELGELGISVSPHTVARLLHQMGYSLHVNHKQVSQVTAYFDRRYYPCGLKPTPHQVASLRLQRHETLPEWNYTIRPQL